MSWRRPAAPLLCRGNQALAAGSETRRRSVDGRVCLRNSPRPCESRSHLSGFPSVNVGLAPPAWQWRLGGEECLINTSPSGTHDFHGYHRLNCKHHAGRANRAAHDLVQQALKREFQRLGIQVVDNDNDMRQRFLICPLRSEGIWPFYLRVTILFMIRSVNNPSRKLLQM